MAQFIIYKNNNPSTKGRYPYLLDVQAKLLESIDTRMVIPLSAAAKNRNNVFTTLTPVIPVGGKEYMLLTPQMAGIPKKVLGEEVLDVTKLRGEILAALDLLITGV